MSKNEICEEIFLILKQIFENEEKLPKTFEESISDQIDSIEFVMIIVEIEGRFDIKIDDDDFEIENVDSINRLADLIIKYKNENRS
jgi:acyl carrier protein